MCVRERDCIRLCERERVGERERRKQIVYVRVCMCLVETLSHTYLCVKKRESVCECVYMCVSVYVFVCLCVCVCV